MPELPEVQTTVDGLNKKVLCRTFIDVWSDWNKIVKKPNNFEKFKKEIKDKKIKKIWRRAKNIIFDFHNCHCSILWRRTDVGTSDQPGNRRILALVGCSSLGRRFL